MSRDFSKFLNERFNASQLKNPKYSLRSFARALQVHPSTLSQIMRGQRVVTPKTIEKIGRRLGLDDNSINLFQESHQSDRRAGASLSLLPIDQYHVLSDWHHFAVLKLTHLKEFRGNSKWIANSLGITADAVNYIIQRLCRLSLLKLGPGDKWKETSDKVSTIFVGNSGTLRDQIQKETLEKALAAIETVDEKFRLERNFTIAIDTAQLPQVQEKIEAFCCVLADCAEKSRKKNDVYKMQISFFPLTKFHAERSK